MLSYHRYGPIKEPAACVLVHDAAPTDFRGLLLIFFKSNFRFFRSVFTTDLFGSLSPVCWNVISKCFLAEGFWFLSLALVFAFDINVMSVPTFQGCFCVSWLWLWLLRSSCNVVSVAVQDGLLSTSLWGSFANCFPYSCSTPTDGPPHRCSILTAAPSLQLLHPHICFIPTASPSPQLLHPHSCSILTVTSSPQMLHPYSCFIPTDAPFPQMLHPNRCFIPTEDALSKATKPSTKISSLMLPLQPGVLVYTSSSPSSESRLSLQKLIPIKRRFHKLSTQGKTGQSSRSVHGCWCPPAAQPTFSRHSDPAMLCLPVGSFYVWLLKLWAEGVSQCLLTLSTCPA